MRPAANSTQGKQGGVSRNRRFVMRIASEFVVVIVIGLLIAKLLDFTLVALTEDRPAVRSQDERAAVVNANNLDWRDMEGNSVTATDVSGPAG